MTKRELLNAIAFSKGELDEEIKVEVRCDDELYDIVTENLKLNLSYNFNEITFYICLD